jgi:hypothetical protein
MARRAQLRDHRIESGRLAEFAAAWTAGWCQADGSSRAGQGSSFPPMFGLRPAIVDKLLGEGGGSA